MPKTGNTHARRVLGEGAWADRYPAKVSRHVPLRLAKQPKVMQDSSWQAQVRLCKRYQRLAAKGKHVHIVTVAIARELAGFMWAIAKEVPRSLESATDRLRDRCHVWNVLRRCANVHEKSRSPGVVSPSAACRDPAGIRGPR
jgi:hypothetical protein